MAGPILVVSPHLDDAVLSLGGSIAGWVARGTRVVIASVYTQGPPLADIAPSMRKFADYTTRIAEDDAACEVLGAEVLRLRQIERAFRPPYLTGWSFFTTPAERTGFGGLTNVIAALEPLAAVDPAEIHVPFGIGNHIDHVEALLAASDWAIARGWLARLRFYEDFYALSFGIRRTHFQAKRLAAHRPWQKPLLRARRLAVILKTIGARIAGPPVEMFLAPALARAEWTSTSAPVSASAEQQQLAAIACYRSQTRAFGGLAGVDRALRAYHALFRGEPCWRPEVRSP